MSNCCDPVDCSPPGSSVPRNFPGQNTGVGSHFLLQGIFLTQVLNPHFLYYRRSPILQVDSLQTEPPGKPQMYNNKVFFRNFNNIICLAKRYIAIKLKHDLNTSDTWFHTVFNFKNLSFISPPHVMHPHHLYLFPYQLWLTTSTTCQAPFQMLGLWEWPR